MADNVAITAGAGTTISTEEITTLNGGAVSAQHGQRVILAGRTADATAIDVAVASDGDVEVEAHVDQLRISVGSAGLTTATTAYSAGDQVGTMFSLTSAARLTGGTGRITSVLLVDAARIIGAYDVAFFRSSITLASDNAAFAISDTDALELVAYVPLSGSYDLGNNRLSYAYNLRCPYECSGGTTLYAALICRAGHTFFAATGNLQLIVTVERD